MVLNGIYFAVDRVRDGTRGSLVDAPFALIAGADILLTIAAGIYILVQLVRLGDVGANAFGPPPDDYVWTARVPAVDPLSELERLRALHQAGVLTDAEFARRKAAVLGQR